MHDSLVEFNKNINDYQSTLEKTYIAKQNVYQSELAQRYNPTEKETFNKLSKALLELQIKITDFCKGYKPLKVQD